MIWDKTKNLIIYNTDKQLGMYAEPWPKYLKQSLNKHMRNPCNYVWLTLEEAKKELQEQKRLFIAAWKTHGCSMYEQYFQRSIDWDAKKGSRIPQFYSLWKVHKKNDSVCPVISSVGSFPEVFSIFINEMLKRLVQDFLDSFIISADQLEYKLTKRFPDKLPNRAKLFSIDVVGMYININTVHAIKVVEKIIDLYANEFKDLQLPKSFIIKCIHIIMTRNIFQFKDTF